MDCVFCKIINGDIPSKKVYEDDLVISIMDIDPICDGHILIIPKKHYTDIFELDNEIYSHINTVAKDLTKKLMHNLDKASMTASYNYGDRQVVKHFHLHLLPDLDHGSKKSIDEVYEQIK